MAIRDQSQNLPEASERCPYPRVALSGPSPHSRAAVFSAPEKEPFSQGQAQEAGLLLPIHATCLLFPTHGPSSGFCSKLHPDSGVGHSALCSVAVLKTEEACASPCGNPRTGGHGPSAQVATSPHTHSHTHTGWPPWD